MRNVGLPHVVAPRIPVVYSSSDTDVDVWVDAGSPAIKVQVDVYVQPGVTLSATSTAAPAMDMSGFVAGSTVFLINKGDIRGAGGAGGEPATYNRSGSTDACGGGGGGGGGSIVGAGAPGDTAFPVSDGADGTATTGGANGTAVGPGVLADPENLTAEDGNPGGDAITIGDVVLYVENTVGTSTIWGGGGGGGGGGVGIAVGYDGGSGGDPGDPGADGVAGALWPSGNGGAAGYAIRYTASGAVTFVSGGLDPEVKGSVGT